MKILYGIQGTGNGHLSRAREILPALKNRVQVDVLVSGMHSEISLDHHIRYRAKGLGFKFGKRGGVDLLNTWWHGDVPRFFREISDIDLSSYDMVINDFEPVSAWAARRQHVPCIGLSNQCSMLHPGVVDKDAKRTKVITTKLLGKYAPIDVPYGFHYLPQEPFVFTPIIRKEIRRLVTSDEGHYLVYLPAYSDQKIIAALKCFPAVRWVVFSKHSRHRYFDTNVEVRPAHSGGFVSVLAACRGLLTGAGFGITSEALYLGKKLMVVPMKHQFEQWTNARSLARFGVPHIKTLKRKWHGEVEQWIDQNHTVQLQYPDNAQAVVDKVLSDFASHGASVDEAMALSSGG